MARYSIVASIPLQGVDDRRLVEGFVSSVPR
jgi:hypothetical protein